MTSLRNKIAEMNIQIHFKENSIPSLRGGKLTAESAAQIIDTILDEVDRVIVDMPERGFGFPHNEKDFLEGRFTKHIEAEELRAKLKSLVN
jgi:hypothetical protein